MSAVVVAARDLVYSPAGRRVLDGVHVEARPGEVVAVTGPSGSGKSSLLALLAGLVAPESGVVEVDGQPLAPGTDTGFGLVLQGYGLVAVLTAAENVEVVLQAHGVPRAELRERSAAALDEVGLLEFADRRVDALSGGQRQRVAVARALVSRPRLLLADEPTAQQDARNRARLLRLMRVAAEDGAAVVLATHDDAVIEVCDRQVALHDGRLVDPASVPTAARG